MVREGKRSSEEGVHGALHEIQYPRAHWQHQSCLYPIEGMDRLNQMNDAQVSCE